MTASSNLRRLALEVADLPADALDRVHDEAERIVNAAAPYRSMRGKKRGGLPVGMSRSEQVDDTAGGATFRVQGTVPGWLWANSGTRPHRIPRAHRGPNRRLFVQHPGSPGRHSWHRVVTALQTTVPRIVADEMRKVVR